MLRPRLRPHPATLPSHHHANLRPVLLPPPLHLPSPIPPQRRPVPRQPVAPFIARRARLSEWCTFAPRKPTWRTPCCASSASRLPLSCDRHRRCDERTCEYRGGSASGRRLQLPRPLSPGRPRLIAHGCALPTGCRTKPTGPATVNPSRGQSGQRCASQAPLPTRLPVVPIRPSSRPPLLPTATPRGTRQYSPLAQRIRPRLRLPCHLRKHPLSGPATPTSSGST